MPKQSINEVYSSSPCNSFGKIFIGNVESALNIQTLKKHGIKAVVTVAKHHKLNHSSSDLPDYLYLPALDHTNFDLTIYFDQSSAFIGKCLRYTNVLVHCAAGISRSATIVSAYLMKALDKPSAEIIKLLQSRREIINPNAGFKLQLRFYQSCLKEERKQDLGVKKFQGVLSGKKKTITQSFVACQQSIVHQLQNIQQLSGKQKIFESRRLSFSSHRDSKHAEEMKKRISFDKHKKKNLKLESNKKCFQKMIEDNQRRVEERLSKVLTITNI